MTRSRAPPSAWPERRSDHATSWGTTSPTPGGAGRARTAFSRQRRWFRSAARFAKGWACWAPLPSRFRDRLSVTANSTISGPAFWQVERLWKVHPINYLHVFDGTPFKNVIWRLMGVRIGRRVFDDGVHISEPTLTTIGDDCVLNYRSKIQCHSQEDGTFKSDRTTLGAGCTIGVSAFVHYGVTMGDGSALAADSFLMKGEDVPPRARWGGNPAREM